MKTVLMTGFDPFGGEEINASWEAVQRFHNKRGEHYIIQVRQIPTVFEQSAAVLRTAIAEVEPDIVICTGQAGGRREIAVERVALNLDDARIPDNGGKQPVDEPIVPEGPSAYWSTLPVKAIVEGMRQAGIPAALSLSAGTFVCNHLFYALRHMIENEFPAVQGGFIHIPHLPVQVTRPDAACMRLEDIRKGLAIAAAVSVLERGGKEGTL